MPRRSTGITFARSEFMVTWAMPWKTPRSARKTTTAATVASAPSRNPASARPRICRRIKPEDASVMPRIFLRWPISDAPSTGVATVPAACSERARPTAKSEPESANR